MFQELLYLIPLALTSIAYIALSCQVIMVNLFSVELVHERIPQSKKVYFYQSAKGRKAMEGCQQSLFSVCLHPNQQWPYFFFGHVGRV